MKRETIERLFKQHYAKMQRVARTLLYDEQDSEDVVSDIFESLLNGQTVLLPDTEERYLLTAVRNRRFICRSSRSRPYLQHRVLHLSVSDILNVIHERFLTRRQPQHRQSRRKQ